MSDKPYLGRCKEKGCDYALFATPEQIRNANDASDIKAGAGPFRLNPYGVLARCSNRHKWFVLRQIKGTYSKDHKCDSRCLNAKGNDCTCSCGGLNHGRGYAVDAHVHTPTVVISSSNERMISEPQAKFIRTLLDERVIPPKNEFTGEQRKQTALNILNVMTMAQASKTIEWLLTLEGFNVQV